MVVTVVGNDNKKMCGETVHGCLYHLNSDTNLIVNIVFPFHFVPFGISINYYSNLVQQS